MRNQLKIGNPRPQAAGVQEPKGARVSNFDLAKDGSWKVGFRELGVYPLPVDIPSPLAPALSKPHPPDIPSPARRGAASGQIRRNFRNGDAGFRGASPLRLGCRRTRPLDTRAVPSYRGDASVYTPDAGGSLPESRRAPKRGHPGGFPRVSINADRLVDAWDQGFPGGFRSLKQGVSEGFPKVSPGSAAFDDNHTPNKCNCTHGRTSTGFGVSTGYKHTRKSNRTRYRQRVAKRPRRPLLYY